MGFILLHITEVSEHLLHEITHFDLKILVDFGISLFTGSELCLGQGFLKYFF